MMDKDKVLLIIFCVLLPLFLLLLSYKVNLFFSNLNVNQQQTIDFLQNGGQLNLEYTTLEISHLEDVKRVMRGVNIAFYVLLLVVTLILTYYRRNEKQLYKLFKYGGITTLVFIGVLLLLAILSFNYIFTLFHQIFFPQGNWLFAADSLLIQTFPLNFFIGISVKTFVGALVMATFLTIVSFIATNGINQSQS